MSTETEKRWTFSAILKAAGRIILWLILPLIVGVALAQWFSPRPAVGVVRLRYDIWSGSANFIMQQIDEARRDPRIRAIVLQMDSPGGEVVATQTLFLEVQNLRRRMPVVGSIDNMAASGAFYLAMATDPIFAKPSSDVGNVGVWSLVPQDISLSDLILASGPFKLTASNQDEFVRQIESIKQEFIATVVTARGQRLTISPSDLSQGLLYTGRDALRLGLIDHLGAESDAIKTAAAQAGIHNYDVIDLEARVIAKQLAASGTPSAGVWQGATDAQTGQRKLPPGIYLLYDPRLGGTP